MTDPGGAPRRAAASIIVLAAAIACVQPGRLPRAPRWSAELPPLLLAGDTGVTDTIAGGALHRSFLVRQAPWAIHVLDIDRDACWTPVAAKGAPGAVGRTRTSVLTASLAGANTTVAGGINADFFMFDPPGVPTGVHVSDGVVVTGPGVRPVFAVGSDGQPWIGLLTVYGTVMSASDSFPITSWNRTAPEGLAWMDARYGSRVDTASGSVRVTMTSQSGPVQVIDSGLTATPIPSSGGVLVLGSRAPAELRRRFVTAARDQGRFAVDVKLLPIHPREAVGGFPVLVRDSAEVPGLDSAGAATFAPVRHPRTIVGVGSRGRRLLLITIDGRQPGYSAGATNRESARVALELGATEAINLDGGGSTTMVVARQRPERTSYEVVNRPSDPQGERAVGNALVVVRHRTLMCARQVDLSRREKDSLP